NKVKIFHAAAERRGRPITEDRIAYGIDTEPELANYENFRKQYRPKDPELFVHTDIEEHLAKLKKEGRKIKIFEFEFPWPKQLQYSKRNVRLWSAIRERLTEKPRGLLLITTEINPAEVRITLEEAGFEVVKVVEDYKPANPTLYYRSISSPERFRIIAKAKKNK
ncbi:MAG: hypothetical protein V1672_03565, partial [Candidatus Diapherotrites archaeon]